MGDKYYCNIIFYTCINQYTIFNVQKVDFFIIWTLSELFLVSKNKSLNMSNVDFYWFQCAYFYALHCYYFLIIHLSEKIIHCWVSLPTKECITPVCNYSLSVIIFIKKSLLYYRKPLNHCFILFITFIVILI